MDVDSEWICFWSRVGFRSKRREGTWGWDVGDLL